LKSNLVSGIFWFVVGIGLCIWSSFYEIGSIGQPGPGFLPMGLGALIAVFALVLIAAAVREKGDKGEPIPVFSSRWKAVLMTLAALFLAALFFEKIGYLLTFLFLSIFLMILGGLRSWKRIAAISFCTALGVYLCFVLLLKQPLPVGILRF